MKKLLIEVLKKGGYINKAELEEFAAVESGMIFCAVMSCAPRFQGTAKEILEGVARIENESHHDYCRSVFIPSENYRRLCRLYNIDTTQI